MNLYCLACLQPIWLCLAPKTKQFLLGKWQFYRLEFYFLRTFAKFMTKMKLLKPILKEQNDVDVEVHHERVKSRATKCPEQYLTPIKKRDYQKQ